jgi:hypothetical protein
MRIRDSYFSEVPTFESRLLYAQFTNSYDIDAEAAWGYKDAAKELLESHRPVKELDEYIEQYSKENEPLSDYDRAYISAYKDYIKQERMVTNE